MDIREVLLAPKLVAALDHCRCGGFRLPAAPLLDTTLQRAIRRRNDARLSLSRIGNRGEARCPAKLSPGLRFCGRFGATNSVLLETPESDAFCNYVSPYDPNAFGTRLP